MKNANHFVFVGHFSVIKNLSDLSQDIKSNNTQKQDFPLGLFVDNKSKEYFLVIDARFKNSSALGKAYKDLGSSPEDYEPLLLGRIFFSEQEKVFLVYFYQDSGSVNNENHQREIHTRLMTLASNEEYKIKYDKIFFSYPQNI